MSEQLWARAGDAGEYEPFGNDLDAVIEYLNDVRAGAATGWIDGGMGVGMETVNYWGQDFISLYWGDRDANLVRALSAEERANVAAGLEEVYI